MNPQQGDLFGPPHPTYKPENAITESQGRLQMSQSERRTIYGNWAGGRFDGAEVITEDGRVLLFLAEPHQREDKRRGNPMWTDETEQAWRHDIIAIARGITGARYVQFDPGRDAAEDFDLESPNA